VWDDWEFTDPPTAAGRPNLDTPAGLGGLISSNWADGSLRADDDPYPAAIERQRQAIADWRAVFPEAVAALPPFHPDATAERRQAAWNDWRRRFPEAAARRADVYRPVEDFLE
jgi:hypothetical protein